MTTSWRVCACARDRQVKHTRDVVYMGDPAGVFFVKRLTVEESPKGLKTSPQAEARPVRGLRRFDENKRAPRKLAAGAGR